MNHRVLLFARYAELFGTPQVDVTLPDQATVNDLVAALRRLPGGAELPEHPMVAVNLTQSVGDTALRAGDEVALLPPLAGG